MITKDSYTYSIKILRQDKTSLIAEPSIDPKDLKDGDIQYNTDFRSVYASILQSWLKTNSVPILGKQFPTLPIVA